MADLQTKKFMKRVTAIGGIFIKYNEPEKMRDWYQTHLGLRTDSYGTSFEWRHADEPNKKGYSVWSTFQKNSNYFEPSQKEFMINMRVDDLESLLAVLKQEGVTILNEIQEYEYGKFAHILDPEGVKIELWEAVDEEYEKMITEKNTTK